jgi:hypothetical protein
MNDQIIDAYTVMKIAGEMFDEAKGYINLPTPYHWELNSLWHDAGKIYIEEIMKRWDKEIKETNH